MNLTLSRHGVLRNGTAHDTSNISQQKKHDILPVIWRCDRVKAWFPCVLASIEIEVQQPIGCSVQQQAVGSVPEYTDAALSCSSGESLSHPRRVPEDDVYYKVYI